MTPPLTVECPVHVRRHAHGRKELRAGPAPAPAVPAGRVPRVARLLALAHRLDGLLRDGTVAGTAELAALGRVTRARVCQILNLLFLAPDVQEAVLFLPRTTRGRDPIHLAQLQPIAATPDWAKQRRQWRRLHARAYPGAGGDARPAGA